MKFTIPFLIAILISTLGFSQENIVQETKPLNNIFSANLISVAAYGELSGPGVGLSYEHILKTNEKVGIQIPATFYFGDYSNAFTIAPTLKIYPFGSQKVVTWSVGAGLRYVTGTYKPYNFIYPYGQPSYKSSSSVNYIGSEVQNALNVNIGKIYLNLNSSLGLIYNDGGTGIANLNLLMGVRF